MNTDLATDLTAVALLSPVILLVLRLALRHGRMTSEADHA
jgi:hypothetical protein